MFIYSMDPEQPMGGGSGGAPAVAGGSDQVPVDFGSDAEEEEELSEIED